MSAIVGLLRPKIVDQNAGNLWYYDAAKAGQNIADCLATGFFANSNDTFRAGDLLHIHALDKSALFNITTTEGGISPIIEPSSYKGTYNASTNTPHLENGVGSNGDYYLVTVAGTNNPTGQLLGLRHLIIYNGEDEVWQDGGASTKTDEVVISDTYVETQGTVTPNVTNTTRALEYLAFNQNSNSTNASIDKSVDYQVLITDNIIKVDTTAGDINITLPDTHLLTNKYTGRSFLVIKVDGSNNHVLIKVSAGGDVFVNSNTSSGVHSLSMPGQTAKLFIDVDAHKYIIGYISNTIIGTVNSLVPVNSGYQDILTVMWDIPLLNTDYTVQANVVSNGTILFNLMEGSQTTTQAQFRVVNIGNSIVDNITINAIAKYN